MLWKHFSSRLRKTGQRSPVHPSRAAEAALHQPEALVLSIAEGIPRRRGSRWEQLTFHGSRVLRLLFKALKCDRWA